MSALGSLVVKLGLDYAQYTGGLDKSEQAALAAAKKIQDTFDGMKARVAATAGAVAGGLAAGFTIAAFRGIISGAIDTGAALDDLRMQTGATVEALSGLVAVGKFNNMGPEQIGAAMNKLASNLASATEEGKGAGKALEALGIDFDKFKLMRPEEQMQTVAKAMAGFEDGTGKAAVAMALYGKQGAQMLPFLHDLADVGELQAKVSTEQAAAAANLDDNLTRLSTSGEAWKKELANGMIPALDLGAQALVDMMNGSGGLREEVRRLVADGSIKQWTTDAIKGLSYVADVGQIAWRVLQSIGKGLGGLAAALVQALSGDFRSAWATLQASGQDMIDVFDGPTVGARFRESLDKVAASAAATGDAAAKARPSLDGFANTADKAGKTAAAAKDPFDALRESVVKVTAAYQAEATAGEKLTEGQKKAIDVLDQLRTGKVKVTEAQAIQIGKDIEAMLAAEGENKAREEFIKTADAERAARLKTAQAMEQAAASAEEQNRALRDEIELIGLTDAAQLRVLQQRNEAIILTKEATLAELERASAITGTMTREQIALQAEIEALRERNGLLGARYEKTEVAKAAQAAAGEWTKFTDSIYNGLSDSLYRGFEAGKGFFKSFWDGIKNTAKTTVLKFGVQGIMTGVSGFLGLGSSAAAAATGGAAAVGGAGNLLTAASLAGNSSFMMGLSGAWGAGGGLMSTLNAGTSLLQTGTLSSITSGLGTIAGALGPIALGVGAVVSLIKKLDDSGTIHTGALSQYSAAGGLANSTSHGAFGMGFGGVDYSAETEKFTGAMAQSIVQMLDSTATTFGKEAGYKAATAFADDTSKDGAWGGLLISKLEETIVNWDPTRTSKWAPKEFADGAAGREQYLAAVAADVRVALDSIGLPAWATGLLDKLGQGATLEQLAAAVDQINSGKLALQRLGAIMPSLADLSDEVTSALAAASGGMGALAGNLSVFYSEFFSDAERSAVVMGELQAEVEKLGLEMPTTREQFKELVAGQIALGEEGAAAAAKLLGLGGAFAAVVPRVDAATVAVEANTAAVDDSGRAADEAAKKWQSITDALTADRVQLDIDLLRAQGQEEAALAAERARAIDGYDAYQVALYDSNQAIRDQITGLGLAAEEMERLAELSRTLAAELPAVLDKFLTPEQRTAAQYTRIAGDLITAGLSDLGINDLASALANAGKDDIAAAAMAIYNMTGVTDEMRLALVRAAGGLADLKDAADGTAKANDLNKLDKAWQAVQRAMTAERSLLQQTITDTSTLFRMLGDNVRSLYGEVAQTAAWQSEQGNAFIDNALRAALSTGVLPDSEDLRNAVTAARSGIDAALYSSQAEADFAKMVLANRLQALETVAGDQLTEAEQQLQALDDLLKSEQAAMELLRAQLSGQDSEVAATLSVVDAVNNLHALMATMRAGGAAGAAGAPAAGAGAGAAGGVLNGPGGSQYDPRSGTFYAGGSGLPYLAQDLGAAAIDMVNAGYARELYDIATTNGVTSDMLAAWTGADAGALRDWAQAMGLPAFAGGGWHGGGWAMVGEAGPELAYMPPARIYNAGDTQRMLGGGAGGSSGGSEALLGQVVDRLGRLELLLGTGNGHSQRTADLIDRVTAGGNAMAIETE